MSEFSIKEEVKVVLKEKLGMDMSEEQVNDVVETVTTNESFLSFLNILIVKGIKEVSERDNIPVNEDEIEKQIFVSRESINYDEF